MRYIQKSRPPMSLEKYKLRAGADFNKLGTDEPEVKEELRLALLTEQGYICAYCGSKIDDEYSIIEHIRCRQNHPRLQLEYTNMVCSCLGGQDRRSLNPKYPLYCDAIKGNHEIPVSPLDECCCELFIYDDMGGIHDNDSADARTTIEILNLDNAKLRHRRKAAIDAYRYLPENDTDWNAELQHLYNYQSSGRFAEFCFILEQYIKNYKMIPIAE